MNSKKSIEVARESWCDVRLVDISWGSEGRDLILTFLMHENKIGELTCTWAHSNSISLVGGINEGGYPLTYDAKIDKNNGNGWEVVFDFAGRGVVELKCNELILEYSART
ncbi:hypothetical protein JYU12_00500 [bacterium AH-315-K03]|nr:hypothetical protein [bacterium AH-315-K03]